MLVCFNCLQILTGILPVLFLNCAVMVYDLFIA